MSLLYIYLRIWKLRISPKCQNSSASEESVLLNLLISFMAASFPVASTIENIKGTVRVFFSEPPFKEGNVQFTTVPL